MLVLSRKVGEKIVIGNNITIVVQRIGKGRVALAIEAPQEVTVLRGELAPFGIEAGTIEFIDGEADGGLDTGDQEEALPPVERTNRPAITRTSPRVPNNRLRTDASSRTGFPRSTTPLNPASDLAARLPHTFPSR